MLLVCLLREGVNVVIKVRGHLTLTSSKLSNDNPAKGKAAAATTRVAVIVAAAIAAAGSIRKSPSSSLNFPSVFRGLSVVKQWPTGSFRPEPTPTTTQHLVCCWGGDQTRWKRSRALVYSIRARESQYGCWYLAMASSCQLSKSRDPPSKCLLAEPLQPVAKSEAHSRSNKREGLKKVREKRVRETQRWEGFVNAAATATAIWIVASSAINCSIYWPNKEEPTLTYL